MKKNISLIIKIVIMVEIFLLVFLRLFLHTNLYIWINISIIGVTFLIFLISYFIKRNHKKEYEKIEKKLTDGIFDKKDRIWVIRDTKTTRTIAAIIFFGILILLFIRMLFM